VSAQEQQLLAIADDELVLGWRDSEWTGIAPMLEEDVAFSSIAQNEIGHARAIYQLLVTRSGAGKAAAFAPGRAPSSLRTATRSGAGKAGAFAPGRAPSSLRTATRSGAGKAGAFAPGRAPSSLRTLDADALALDRAPEEYRCSPLVEQRFVHDWGRTIARRVLYEAADELRLEQLKASPDAAVAGLAAKIDREEAYHRMHAEMWRERLRDEPRFREAVGELWPYALGLVDPQLRAELAARLKLPETDPVERGSHVDDWAALWDEMTIVRRSVPGATW
jgi:1,2-phenylacetyl-CoA epoxidase catalytic subunit